MLRLGVVALVKSKSNILEKNMPTPILVTGAAGRTGGIGRTVTKLLLDHGHPVRAMVRKEDERSKVLRELGAEVVTGDLLDLQSMHGTIR